MLMKDSTAVSNQWCMWVKFLGGAILFDPLFTQYKVQRSLSTILKKKSNKIIEILTRKSDKNQLEIVVENYLICIFMNINENLKIRTKPLEKLVPHGVIDLH